MITFSRLRTRPHPTHEPEAQPFVCGCGGTSTFGHAYTAVPFKIDHTADGDTIYWSECPFFDSLRMPRRNNGVPAQVHARMIGPDGKDTEAAS